MKAEINNPKTLYTCKDKSSEEIERYKKMVDPEYNEARHVIMDVNKQGPCTQFAYMLLRSPQVVRFLEGLSGKTGLVPDMHFDSGKGVGLV